MTTKTTICNRALTKVGEKRATDIDNEDSVTARMMNSMFDEIKAAELESYFWTFALKRTILAPLTTTPEFTEDFGVQYQLPIDYLTVYKIIDNPDYIIEGDKILTNQDTELKLVYVADIDKDGYRLFSPSFIEALACRLALEAVEERTQSNTKYQRNAMQYEKTIKSAKRTNAISLPPQDYDEPDDWILARGGHDGFNRGR